MHVASSIDAVVIGSGFGGSVAALRLGRAGVQTVVLERGRRWPLTAQQDTFCTYRKPDGRCGWLRTTTPVYQEVPIEKYVGLVERIDARGINVLAGAGVGGGSLVYNGVIYRPTPEHFARAFPASINYDEMVERYYDRVASILKPSPIPPDVLATEYYKSTRIFMEQATNAGLPNRLLDLAVDWDTVREEINGTKIPSAIIGEIWYGINSGAKKSLDRNYLTEAEKTGKVEIVPLHVVTGLSVAQGGGYEVAYREINESGQAVSTGAVRCRHLFLGAGSMGTSALLVAARAKGTLPDLSPAVGEDWGNNGDSFATRTGLSSTNPGQGGPAGALIAHFDNPIAPVSMIGYPDWTAPEGTLTSLAMALSMVRGKFVYDAANDSVHLDWPADAPGNQKIMEATDYTYKLLDDANPTQYPIAQRRDQARDPQPGRNDRSPLRRGGDGQGV